jgi:ATP-dependent DNA helicase RecG
MTAEELAQLLATMRRLGGEPDQVEVKRASGGLPQSVRQTLSAFANTDGGTIMLGVDEADGFAVVDLSHPMALRDQLAQMSRDDLTPPLLISTEVVEVEGQRVVVALVPGVPVDQRPVYVTSRGIINGSFVRSGDGDRQLTQAEIALLVSGRSQPTYDREPVPGTSADDLDPDALHRTLGRIRGNSPRFGRSDDATVMHRIAITTSPEPGSPLTLAGLLVFGQFPQQWFPQLMVSVVVHPLTDSGSVRFIDNVTARGSIPELVETTLVVIRRNLAVRSVMSDKGSRVDHIEYPLAVVREAVVNALLHRDYSPITRGAQIQVELFPDRLVVRSPGGLYGPIAIGELAEGAISTSRNGVLASLLSDTYLPFSSELVAENRASGIAAMMSLTRKEGLPEPTFSSTITSFTTVMDRAPLFDGPTTAWLDVLPDDLRTPAHEVAAAMLRRGPTTITMLRRWGVDGQQATTALGDLVHCGLAIPAVRHGESRYLLSPSPPTPSTGQPSSGAALNVAQALQLAGEATTAELAQVTRRSRATVSSHLRVLIEQGQVLAQGASRSPKKSYRWIGPV